MYMVGDPIVTRPIRGSGLDMMITHSVSDRRVSNTPPKKDAKLLVKKIRKDGFL